MQNKFKSVLLFGKKHICSKDAGILFSLLIGAGLLSVWLKQELTADFFLYHYYNGFSFLNNRLTFDIAPANVATYYNPLLDALLYLLNNTFPRNPYLFIMGFPAGMALFLVYKISDLFFPDKKGIWIPASLLVSLTGYAFFRQIGTSTHEITTACFVLGSIYILLKKTSKSFSYFIAGALLGAAAGFKLTAALYCISAGITLILFYKTLEKPKTFIGIFIFGGLTGFLTTNGFWMWTLWKNFQNPFFPFLNSIFKSPYFYDADYIDDVFLSYNWKKMLFLPFIIFSGNDPDTASVKNLTSISAFSDARWMIAYLLFFVFLIKSFSPSFRSSVSKKTLFIITFLFLFYLIWLLLSQNIRYTTPVEMLFGVVFIKALSVCSYPKTFLRETLTGSAVLICFLILLSTPLFCQRWGRYIRFSLPDNAALPENALILTTGVKSSYFATLFAEKTNARIMHGLVHIAVRYGDFSDKNEFQKIKKKIINQNTFPVIFIISLADGKEPQIENNICHRMNIEDFVDFRTHERAFVCSTPEIINGIFHNTPLTTDKTR